MMMLHLDLYVIFQLGHLLLSELQLVLIILHVGLEVLNKHGLLLVPAFQIP